MTNVQFGRLEDLAPRDAWNHEAQDFTPWLADNLDQISAAVGLPLELTGQEVRVDTFAADILARNLADDSVVLIENQLEKTDHTHLGQIMTYLAGLDAKTIIWIAPEFRKAHLSAIHWLNDHTIDGFSFFAIRLRVVKIVDSPFAPIFEVLAQPDDWQRVVSEKKRTVDADLYEMRHEFWTAFTERYPELQEKGLSPTKVSNSWLRLHAEPEINLSIFAGLKKSGAFLRGGRGIADDEFAAQIDPYAERLKQALKDADWGDASRGYALWTELDKTITTRQDWPVIIEWMKGAHDAYQRAVSQVVGQSND